MTYDPKALVVADVKSFLHSTLPVEVIKDLDLSAVEPHLYHDGTYVHLLEHEGFPRVRTLDWSQLAEPGSDLCAVCARTPLGQVGSLFAAGRRPGLFHAVRLAGLYAELLDEEDPTALVKRAYIRLDIACNALRLILSGSPASQSWVRRVVAEATSTTVTRAKELFAATEGEPQICLWREDADNAQRVPEAYEVFRLSLGTKHLVDDYHWGVLKPAAVRVLSSTTALAGVHSWPAATSSPEVLETLLALAVDADRRGASTEELLDTALALA